MKVESVLIVCNTRFWNAEAHYAINLCRAFKNQGIDIVFAGNYNSKAYHKALDYKITTVKRLNLDSFFYWPVNLFILFNAIKKKKFQIVNSFKPNGALTLYILKLFFKYKWIRTRSIASPPRYNSINSFIYGRLADGIITPSALSYNWLLKLKLKNSLKLIYFGEEQLKSRLTKIQAKSILQLAKNKFVFALLGRSQALKGQLDAIIAFSQLTASNYLLLFIKDLAEYPDELKNIKNLIAKLKLQTKIKIMGPQKNLADSLKAVDCALIPSLESENICRVLVEFASLHIPAIVYPTGALPELIVNGKNGFVCEKKEPDSLAKYMERICKNKKLQLTLAKNTYNIYNSNYRLDTFGSKTLNFYQKIINSK